MTTTTNIIIAASVVGFEIFLLLVIFGILLYRKYIRKRNAENAANNNNSPHPNSNPSNMDETQANNPRPSFEQQKDIEMQNGTQMMGQKSVKNENLVNFKGEIGSCFFHKVLLISRLVCN